jgi:hypothetical protein
MMMMVMVVEMTTAIMMTTAINIIIRMIISIPVLA